jgi:hypothetical protein
MRYLDTHYESRYLRPITNKLKLQISTIKSKYLPPLYFAGIVNIAKILEPKKLLGYQIIHPNPHPLIILQISHGEYTLFSANIFVGLRALWCESIYLIENIGFLR